MKTCMVIFSWSLSVLISVYIGYKLNGTTSNNPIALIKKRVTKKPSLAVRNRKLLETKIFKLGRRLQVTKSTQQSTINQIVDDLINCFEKPDYDNFDNFRFIANIWSELQDLDEQQIYKVYDHLESEGKVTRHIAKIIFARLAQLNPSGAIEFAASKKKYHAITEIINSWSSTTPDRALEWIVENKKNYAYLSDVNYYSLFDNISKTDINKALKNLIEFDNAKQDNALRGILNNAETNEEFSRILTYLNEYKNNTSRINLALHSWGGKSPKEALSWAQSIDSDKKRNKAFKRIKSSWLMKNPIEASNWIMENTENVDAAIPNIVNHWIFHDPKGLQEWIENQKIGRIRDFANYQVARQSSYKNFDLSIKALDKIKLVEIRKKAVMSIYRRMSYRDENAAINFLQNRSEISDEEKIKLLSTSP